MEDELERHGMLVLNEDDATTTKKKMKMKMNVCVDSRSRSTFACAGSEAHLPGESDLHLLPDLVVLAAQRLNNFQVGTGYDFRLRGIRRRRQR